MGLIIALDSITHELQSDVIRCPGSHCGVPRLNEGVALLYLTVTARLNIVYSAEVLTTAPWEGLYHLL